MEKTLLEKNLMLTCIQRFQTCKDLLKYEKIWFHLMHTENKLIQLICDNIVLQASVLFEKYIHYLINFVVQDLPKPPIIFGPSNF